MRICGRCVACQRRGARRLFKAMLNDHDLLSQRWQSDLASGVGHGIKLSDPRKLEMQ